MTHRTHLDERGKAGSLIDVKIIFLSALHEFGPQWLQDPNIRVACVWPSGGSRWHRN
jgi:hypothetical protein